MKHLSGLLNKLTAVAAVAIALTSCNRAEYAMLPKTSSAYHGTQRATIVKPTPAAAPATSEVAVAPAAEVAAAPVAAPAVAAPAAVAPAAKAPAVAQVTPAAKPAKLTLMQKALVQKIAKKADKLAAKAQIKPKSETAAATALSGNLRTGIILLIVGALVTLLPGSIFGLIGGIIALIGLIFIILWLLDEV